MEMHAGERWRLTLFASSFLEWIKDESASSFARDVGTPASISVEEKEGDAQTTFHLTLTWSQFSTEELAHARAPRDTPASSLFTDAETPVFKQLTDLTMMMATVLERSQQHRRHSTRVRHVPDWIVALLVTGAERGRQVFARWTDAAIGSTAAVLDRARPRGRQVAALWHSARLGSLARAQSVPHLLRARSSAIIKPMSWAAAGLVAASVIYVGWASSRPATRPVARGIGAAVNPPASQPATIRAPQTRKSPAALVADARRTEAEPLRTSSVAQAAPAIPAAFVSPARATTSATRVKSAPQARSYVGSLVVTSEPEGADVSVDGVPQGRTPLTISNLNIGSRVVRLDLPGHQRWSWAVSVGANRRTPVAVRLYPSTPVNAPPGASSAGVSATRARMF